MRIKREWAMPDHNTFSIKPIREWIGEVPEYSVDPFARNSELARLTNDLNPETNAQENQDALVFLKGIWDGYAQFVLYDPPYSLRQLKECYDGLGRAMTQRESQHFFSDVKNEIARITRPGGVVLSFGWSTVGMGKSRGFEIQDILLVCHGGIHNDTICVREVKL
jgi:hypothetical protein